MQERRVLKVVVAVVMAFFFAGITVAQEKTETKPLSAWICLRTEVDKDWDAIARYTEVFLRRGSLVPADIYYLDVGSTSYQELGFSIGHKLFSVRGLNFWALPYYVVAEDSQYLGPSLWIQGCWGRWIFSSLPMYYLPLENEGVEHFSTRTTFLNYKINDWLQIGVSGNAIWADGENEEWRWRIGPNFVINDPVKLLPGGTGNFNLRATWDEDGEFSLRIEKTFTF